jgi:hypothetical protein
MNLTFEDMKSDAEAAAKAVRELDWTARQCPIRLAKAIQTALAAQNLARLARDRSGPSFQSGERAAS